MTPYESYPTPPDFCAYCGAPAGTVDHVPPRTAAGNGAKHWLVPCCSECNSLLGARPLYTVEERQHFLAGAIRRRYEKVLRVPRWTAEELSEVGPSLRMSILSTQALSDAVRARLAFVKAGQPVGQD